MRNVLLRCAFALAAIVAGAVICFDALRIARERRMAEDVSPRSGRFVRAADVTMFVQEAGRTSSPVVVLIHGTGTWSEIWRETIQPLAAHYRVIAIDVPPFGYSEKPDGAGAYTVEKQGRRIVAAMDALGIPSATLVAHSIGARPAVEAALARPDRFERLILVDPALGFPTAEVNDAEFEKNTPSAFQRFIFGLGPLRNALISSYGTNPLFMRRIFGSFVARKEAVTDARLATILQPMNVRRTTPAYGDWLEHLMLQNDSSASTNVANLARLTMPVGIIWGDEDTVTPLWQSKALARRIPHARIAVIHGVGHIPYIEDPIRFNEVLGAMLRFPDVHASE